MIMSNEDYIYLYGQLTVDKIPEDIYTKIMVGEDFTTEEEKRIKAIIEKDRATRK